MARTKDSTQTSSASTESFNFESITTSLASALSSADSDAAQRMQTLTLVRQARLAQLSRTAASLKAQFGSKDPGVINAEAAVTAETNTVARLTVARQELTTPALQVAAKGWALQGRVYDSSLTPLPNMTVFLVDAANTFQQQFGFAYTDQTGYFLISVAEAGARSSNDQPIFLEVADAKSRPVYLSDSPVEPVPGVPLYQRIVLASGGKPIGDPHKAIRGTALPARTKKK